MACSKSEVYLYLYLYLLMYLYVPYDLLRTVTLELYSTDSGFLTMQANLVLCDVRTLSPHTVWPNVNRIFVYIFY